MDRVLLVEDEPSLQVALGDCLMDEGYAVTVVGTVESALGALRDERPDLVLCDLRLPDGDGMTVLSEAARTMPDVPVVILTAYGSVASAIEAIRSGASEYLTKPFEEQQLLAMVRRHLELGRLRRRVEELEGVTARPLGNDPAFRRLVDMVRTVAASDSTVLLLGETGTGKEVLARFLHESSPRRRKPFVAVNCAALPDTLVESELFGHARGSFSGATEARRGLFEEAHRGTLFLDEIGALPLSAQAKLLRVLEEGRVRRVGENRVTDVRVRVLAATSLDMEAAIGRREFREDLYYRLSALELLVPPLRERPEDIPLLVEHFLRMLREQGGPERTLSTEALELLTSYPFPGNVRELKHAVEQAAVFGDGPVLGPTDFRALWGRSQMLLPASEPRGGRSPIVDVTPARLEEALRRTGGNRLEAARLLGISRSSFYRILRRLPAAEASAPD